MYTAIYLAVWFAGSAMMIKEGLWSNTIALVNIVISGLVAFGFYSPIAIYFDELTNGEYTYLLDFVCIWTLFVIAMVVCRTLTGGFSRTRMRFKNPVEPVLGPLMAVLDSWVMAAFVMATLHTSPMPKDAFSSGLIYSDNEVESNGVESKWALFNPDLGWLRFVERVTPVDSFGAREGGGFSAKAFVRIYADHREKYDRAKPPWIRVRRG